jgi:hypothetical protein
MYRCQSVSEPFDIILTHAGYVGRGHYRSVKCAVSAMLDVKENGIMVIAANNIDAAPIGSPEYKKLLHLLKILGPDRYVPVLRHPDWLFTKDQWEPEMWGKPIRKVGEDGLIYCAPHIPKEDYAIIPGISGYECINEEVRYSPAREKAPWIRMRLPTRYLIRDFREGNQALHLLPKDHTRYLF